MYLLCKFVSKHTDIAFRQFSNTNQWSPAWPKSMAVTWKSHFYGKEIKKYGHMPEALGVLHGISKERAW